jgi:hypothetical protein
MKHTYKDRWFADPFILRVTERDIFILAEEYYDPIKRGRIVKLIIDKEDFILKSNEVIFELESHLSFPAIFRKDGIIYLYPENSSIGKLILYRYFEETNTVEPISILLDEPLTDAIISTAFGKAYLFSTKLPFPNGNTLSIYCSDQWNGKYEICQSVSFSDNTARNAGDLFQKGTTWIRPAQDCNGAYGRGVVLQQITPQNGGFSFRELKRFYPTSKKWNLGMHTLNIFEGMIVVDGRRYRNPLIRGLLSRMRHLVKFAIK